MQIYLFINNVEFLRNSRMELTSHSAFEIMGVVTFRMYDIFIMLSRISGATIVFETQGLPCTQYFCTDFTQRRSLNGKIMECNYKSNLLRNNK